jgi:hypothetical protein
MKKLYILITDGQHFLGLVQASGTTLPNHSLWPVTKPIVKHHWPCALVKHVTYGLFDIKDKYTWSDRPFGLAADTSFVVVQTDFVDLEDIVQTHDKIFKWHKHNASFTCPWRLKLYSLQDVSLYAFDLPSAHCIKAYQGGRTKPTDSTPMDPDLYNK